MTEIIVHLTISGLIALQPSPSQPHRWRVVVPDFSASHHPHRAFFLVWTESLRPRVNAKEPYTIFPLKDSQTTISGVTAVNSAAPKELLTLFEAANVTSGKRAKVKHRSDLTPPPALEMWIADAGLEATWVDLTVPWYLKRKNGKVTKPRPIAEEVCLRFKTTQGTLKLFEGTSQEIEIAPKNGIIEIRLGNIVEGSGGFSKVDPHFPMYYEITQEPVPPGDRADLKTDKTGGGTVTPGHAEHELSTVKIKQSDVRLGWPAAVRSLDLAKLFPGPGPRSVTGENCPPIGGDRYP